MGSENLTRSRFSVLGSRSSRERIAVFRALFLGDLLCVVPALRALRECFPHAEITLIGLPWAQDFVQRLPYLDRLLPFPGYPGIMEVAQDHARTAAFLAEQRAYGYDIAIQMHGDGNISNSFVADLDARISIGYRRDPDHRLTWSLPFDPDEHEILRWLHLVAGLGADRSNTRVEFPIAAHEHARAAELLHAIDPTRPLIGLHVGAKDAARRWPPECFAALANTLIGLYDAQIVLTGSDGERALTKIVQQRVTTPVLDLAGQTDIGTFAAVIDRLDLLVTNDTGASHLAAATATPSVVLFGASRPEGWAPLDRGRHRTIDAVALTGAPATEALQQLPIEPVLAACTELLKNQEPSTKNPQSRSGARFLVLGS